MDILKRVFIAAAIGGAFAFLLSVPIRMTTGSSAWVAAQDCYGIMNPNNVSKDIDYKLVNTIAARIKERDEANVTIFIALVFICIFLLCLLIQLYPKQTRYTPKAEFNWPNDQRGTEDNAG